MPADNVIQADGPGVQYDVIEHHEGGCATQAAPAMEMQPGILLTAFYQADKFIHAPGVWVMVVGDEKPYIFYSQSFQEFPLSFRPFRGDGLS